MQLCGRGSVPSFPSTVFFNVDGARTALAGRIDAVAIEGGRVTVALDWKSDVAPTEDDVQAHARQLLAYLRVTAAPRGVLVYMTLGVVRWVTT